MSFFEALRIVVATVPLATVAVAQDTQRVSEAADGTPSDAPTRFPSIASDGRSVVFATQSGNLVAGVSGPVEQVYLKDMVSGVVTLVSADALGNPGDRYSRNPWISEDGTKVVFESAATNFSDKDPDATVDLFLRDVVAGTTTYLRQDSAHPHLSADGNVVAFETDVPFDPNDKNTFTDVYVLDRTTHTVELVSGDASGATLRFVSIEPTLSSDGAFVAFTTGGPLDPNDGNSALDVYVRDRANGVTTRVTTSTTGGDSDDYSRYPWISGDGTRVAFTSRADNLVAGDTNAVEDCFVRDFVAGTCVRVSVASDGTEANDRSIGTALSGDGSTVAFGSAATNLVDPNPTGPQLYVHHLPTGVTHMLSVADDGTPSNLGAAATGITRDGFDVAFWSDSTNLDSNSGSNPTQSYVRHRPRAAASVQSYGAGFPGTLGTPALSAANLPVLASAFVMKADNSLGQTTIGLLALGSQRASIALRHGTLLVDIKFTLPVVVDATGWNATMTVPFEEQWVGVTADAQLFEQDPGAVGLISMTQGLEVVLGY